MNFWSAQTGPHSNGDSRGDRTDRAIATVACPDLGPDIDDLSTLRESVEDEVVKVFVVSEGDGVRVQGCSTIGCTNQAAFATRTQPASCTECIDDILRTGGLEPVEPDDD